MRLLNYAVDFDLPEQMLRALKILADLHLHTSQFEQAFFYYDQTRYAALLLEHSHLLVEALLGMADCCGRCGREQEGIKVPSISVRSSRKHSSTAGCTASTNWNCASTTK